MAKEETRAPGTEIVARRTNPYQLDTSLAPVDWRSLRETFDPQGEKRDARSLVGLTFVITEYRAIESSYEGSDIFYFVKGVFPDTGEIFNTALGGQAVVEVLDSFDALRASYRQAVAMGDSEYTAELEALGANRPIQVKLGFVPGGKYAGYYTFE